MHTPTLKLAGALALVAALPHVTGCSSAIPDLPPVKAAETPSLAGTWRVTISLQDCAGGTPAGKPFESLLTFVPGGALMESTSNSMFFPALRGPGQGSWSSTGDRTYTASTVAHITVNGALTKIQTITQPMIQMDTDNTFQTPSATIRFFAPDGTPLSSGCAVASGRRYGTDGAI